MKFSYMCKDCGRETYEEQPIGSDALEVCPGCGGRYQRLVIAHTIIYKGNGFYTTDSKREKKKLNDDKKFHETNKKQKQWQPPAKDLVGQPPSF